MAGQKHILLGGVRSTTCQDMWYVCFYINKVKVEFVLDDIRGFLLMTTAEMKSSPCHEENVNKTCLMEDSWQTTMIKVVD